LTGVVAGRRAFLTALLSAGLCILRRPLSVWASPSESRSDDVLGLRLAGLLRHRESAAAIGWEYLRRVRQEEDRETLLNLITRGCGRPPRLELDDEELRECIRMRVRQDFDEGYTVRIHGWIVSSTEARLCALATLVFAPTDRR
jgi:hypothetical protein